MKISVHIEADSAEDFREAIAALGVATLSGTPTPPVEEAIRSLIQDVVPVETPLMAAIEELPATVEEAVPVPVAKSKRGPRKAAGNGAKAAPIEAPLTVPHEPAPGVRQDLLDAAQTYVLRYGYNFASKDIPELFQKHIGKEFRKVSEVPDTHLGEAIKLVRLAVAENPYNRRVLQDAA